MPVADELRIQHLLNRYGLAVDSRRWDLFAEIFEAGVRADYGSSGTWDGLASFVDAFERLHGRFDSTQHLMANHVIEVEGPDARAFSYVLWRLVERTERGVDGREGTAWYSDELVHTDQGWRITSRRCRVTWSQRIVLGEGSHGPSETRLTEEAWRPRR